MPSSTSAYDEAMSLTANLHPNRLTAMSPKMTTIIADVVGEEWTDPQIGWLSVSSDGYATTDSDFPGDAADLDRNIRKLLIAAQLSPAERQESARLSRERVDDHRPAESRPDYGQQLH
jgi:hypothetical protein